MTSNDDSERGARFVTTTLAAFVDHLAAPVVLVDSAMTILYANGGAQRMLAQNDVFSSREGVLTIRDGVARAALEEALRNGSDGANAVMLRRGNSRCCVAHVMGLPGGYAGLLIRSLSLDDAGKVAFDLYGLTSRESSVLLAIAEVGGVPATARALGLSEGTVKGYLKSIFQKTGATRQADLVKLAFSLESPFRAEPPIGRDTAS